MTSEALILFRLLGQLPDGLMLTDTQLFIDDRSFEAQEALIGVGLAFETSARIDLLPPIRDYARRNYLPNDDCPPDWPDKVLLLVEHIGRGDENSKFDSFILNLHSDLNNIESAFEHRLKSNDNCKTLRLALIGFRNILTIASRRSSIFDKFAERFEGEHEGPELGLCLKLSADIGFHSGDLDNAARKYAKASHIFAKLGDINWEANTLSSLGDIERIRGNTDSAEDLYLEAISRFRQIGGKLGEANCLSRLGRIEFVRLNFEESKKWHYKSLAVYEELDTTHGKMISWLAIGEAEFFHREYEESEKHLDFARELAIQIGDRRSQAMCLRYLGDIALDGGNLESAENYFQRTLQPEAQDSWPTILVHGLKQLGCIEIRRNSRRLAEQYWLRAERILNDTGDMRQKADFLVWTGIAESNYGIPENGLAQYQRALSLYTELGASAEMSRCRDLIGP
jgi:tetratricopeptide (TPR) repeat protein